MKVQLRQRLPLVLAISAALSTGSALAGDNVPDSGDAWFEQGRQTLKSVQRTYNNEHRARNVILFVGDGMGVSTVTASAFWKASLKARMGSSTA